MVYICFSLDGCLHEKPQMSFILLEYSLRIQEDHDYWPKKDLEISYPLFNGKSKSHVCEGFLFITD